MVVTDTCTTTTLEVHAQTRIHTMVLTQTNQTKPTLCSEITVRLRSHLRSVRPASSQLSFESFN